MKRSQNFDFLGLKNLSSGQFFGELQLTQILNFKLLVVTEKSEIWE